MQTRLEAPDQDLGDQDLDLTMTKTNISKKWSDTSLEAKTAVLISCCILQKLGNLITFRSLLPYLVAI